MNKTEFNNLNPEEKEIVFDEMLELITLVYDNPITIESLKIFTEWCKWIGKGDNELYKLLIGIYPYPELNKDLNNEKLCQLLKHSEDALDVVKFWNNQIKNIIENSKE